MPKLTVVPRTERSIPWGAADQQLIPIPLSAYGYCEQEYFLSGQANVYTLSSGQAQVKHPAITYTDRILVRCPAFGQPFSGRVVVELLNSTNGWDVSPMWSLLWPSLLRRGDAYVGLTIHPVCVAAMQRYDPVRYKSLSLPSPHPGPPSTKILMHQHCSPNTEFGLIWDIMTQLGQALKAEQGKCLLGAPARRVYAVGCSQSAMFLSTYFNVFHESTRPSPLHPPFDGYLPFTGSVMVPLNQQEDPPEPSDPIQVTQNCSAPVIRIMSQWDFCGFAGDLAHRRSDSDTPGDCFRLYELAGQAHNPFVGALYRPGPAQMEKLGQTVGYPATDVPDLPTDAIVRQALYNLDAWVEQNTVPPCAPSCIVVNKTGQPQLDSDGNALGGLRLPQLQVPIGTYHSGTKHNPQDGSLSLFPPEELIARYPTHQAYLDRMLSAIQALLQQGFISPWDARELQLRALTMPIPYRDNNAPQP